MNAPVSITVYVVMDGATPVAAYAYEADAKRRAGLGGFAKRVVAVELYEQ